jgi:hypothetical protein
MSKSEIRAFDKGGFEKTKPISERRK